MKAKGHKSPPFPASLPMAGLATIQSWFDEFSLPHPSDEVCFALARALQIAVNRKGNALMEEEAGHELPILDLKDVSPAEIIGRRWVAFRDAANYLALRLEELADFIPRHEWGEYPGMAELEDALGTISAYPSPLPQAPVPQGRRHQAWHDVGHAISPAIQSALKSSGYTGTVRKTEKDGPTATIGAAAISWAFKIKIESTGFATAMQRRDRGKPKAKV